MLKSENYNVSPIFRVKMEYDKDIDMDNNFIISEEDLWNFFEYELNEIN